MLIPSAIFAASGGAGQGVASVLPETSDQLVRDIRPNGRSIGTYRVKPDGSGDFTTITAAVGAAIALQNTTRIAEGIPWVTPNHRVDIIVSPGDYVGEFATGPFLAFYVDGDYGDVTLRQVPNAGGFLGTVANSGNTYFEGFHIIVDYQASYPGGNPKYPVHAINSGTNIWVGCTFEHKGGPTLTPYGSDGDDGGTTLLYDCVLLPGNTNCHGWAWTRVPQNMIYVDCISQGVVNWEALNNIAVDHLWVIGGNVFGIKLEGNASKLHRDPATVVGAGGINSPSTDNNVNWPIPYGGLSAANRTYWGLP